MENTIYCTTEKSKELDSLYAFNTEIKGKDGFYVYCSEDLINWKSNGLCLSKENVVGENRFWAPEVSYYKGKFYMVYSSEEHLAVAVSDSPTGPFKRHSEGWLRDERAIDGHLLFDENSIYLYFVKLDGRSNRIFVAEMTEDLKHIKYEYPDELIAASEKWELSDGLVAEGPFVLKHKSLYYLFYSCNNTGSVDYSVGYAVSDKPIGPFKKYENNPILHKNGDIVGVGHNSFMPTDDGKFICAYHCHSDNADNYKPRMVCLSEAGFEEENGSDIFKIYY